MKTKVEDNCLWADITPTHALVYDKTRKEVRLINRQAAPEWQLLTTREAVGMTADEFIELFHQMKVIITSGKESYAIFCGTKTGNARRNARICLFGHVH